MIWDDSDQKFLVSTLTIVHAVASVTDALALFK